MSGDESPAGSGETVRPDDPVVELLVVCTGNIARSPLAAVLLEDHARRRLGGHAPVRVRSAGTRARPGNPAVEGSRRAADARGLDLSRHRASPVDTGELADSDLVLTMTAGHRGELARRWPGGRDRTFTLTGFAALADGLPSAPPPAPTAPGTRDGRVRDRVRGVVAAAARARDGAAVDPDDIADPIRLPPDAYDTLADQLDGLVATVADVLFGPVPGGPGRGGEPLP